MISCLFGYGLNAAGSCFGVNSIEYLLLYFPPPVPWARHANICPSVHGSFLTFHKTTLHISNRSFPWHHSSNIGVPSPRFNASEFCLPTSVARIAFWTLRRQFQLKCLAAHRDRSPGCVRACVWLTSSRSRFYSEVETSKNAWKLPKLHPYLIEGQSERGCAKASMFAAQCASRTFSVGTVCMLRNVCWLDVTFSEKSEMELLRKYYEAFYIVRGRS